MPHKTFLTSLVLICCLLAGCAGTSGPATIHHPGAINAFDDQAYTVLKDAQAAIAAAKDALPQLPAAAPTLNKLIRAYNIANEAWQLYHAGSPGASQAQVQNLIGDVAKAATDVLKAFGIKLQPQGRAMNYREFTPPQSIEDASWASIEGQILMRGKLVYA